MTGRILIIGEHVANSGFGIQGDILTTAALGGIPLTVLTQLSTAYSPLKRTFQPVDPLFITQQINASLDCPGIDAIKIGMLPSTDALNSVLKSLNSLKQDIPIVMCPITVSDVGEALISPSSQKELLGPILKKLTVLVLSVREAELLLGVDITDLDSMCDIAHKFYNMGPESVLITGGILAGENHFDVLVTSKRSEQILSHRKSQYQMEEKYNFSGSWVLATAIATRLGQGYTLTQALNHARQYVNNAILNAQTNTPEYQNLNLLHSITPFATNESSSAYTVVSGQKT